jgi:spore maturation protein CgeB
MKIVICGLTITSSWGNGHATTWRSLVKALARLGHRVHFVEKDVEWYRSNRDLPRPEFCTVHLYSHWHEISSRLLQLTADAEAVVIGSYFPDAIRATGELLGAGVDPLLFYDIDTPVTLARLREHGRTEYLDAAMIPRYRAYLSFTGGPALQELEHIFGSPRAVPFYCSVDADLYKPSISHPEFQCDLSYLGTYAADRQPKLTEYLDGAARMLPDRRFYVAGAQYPAEIRWSPNVARTIHLPPGEHPALYSSSRFTLNLTRADMVAAGYSPSVRLFEASACGAAILSDSWEGLDSFLSPGEEILLPRDHEEVIDILTGLPDEARLRMGGHARERILSEHSSLHRARQFEKILDQCYAGSVQPPTNNSASEPMHSSGAAALSSATG